MVNETQYKAQDKCHVNFTYMFTTMCSNSQLPTLGLGGNIDKLYIIKTNKTVIPPKKEQQKCSGVLIEPPGLNDTKRQILKIENGQNFYSHLNTART